MKQMIPGLHRDCLVVRRLCALKIVQLRERDAEVHERRCKVRLEIDRGADELKRGGILSRGEVNETKVVGDDPLQGSGKPG